jgi:predicted DNA-binding ribbon-helix-helix protein
MSKVVRIAPLEAALQVSPADEQAHHDYATPEFRAVQTPYGRKGLRLERAFWHALSAIADRMHIKRSRLISDVLGETGTDDNATSVLRSYAVHQIEQELSTLRQQSELAFLLPVMQHAPTPSFAVDRDKRVVRANGEFRQFLSEVMAEFENSSRDTLVFKLERPVEDLFEELGQSGQSCECMVNIIVGNRLRQFRAKLVAVPPHEPQVLVGYVLNS